MGAWGEKAYENDSAADWFNDVFEPVSKQVQALLDAPVEERLYPEYRAAAWMLTKIGRTFVYPSDKLDDHLSKLHDRLQTIRNDKDWMDSWVDQAAITKEMDDQILQMQRVCKWNNVTINF